MIKVITDLSPLYRLAQKYLNAYCLASLKSTCARVTTNLGLKASILLTYVHTKEYNSVLHCTRITTALYTLVSLMPRKPSIELTIG